MYRIPMGVPEMAALWEDPSKRYEKNELSRTEKQFFKKFVKVLSYLSENPRHPSLSSHDIDALSKRYGFKVWQSYLDNRKPAADRLFWAYGPGRREITVLAIEPHPEDKKSGAYARIKLSDLPPLREK